jgi:hypothetical protein
MYTDDHVRTLEELTVYHFAHPRWQMPSENMDLARVCMDAPTARGRAVGLCAFGYIAEHTGNSEYAYDIVKQWFEGHTELVIPQDATTSLSRVRHVCCLVARQVDEECWLAHLLFVGVVDHHIPGTPIHIRYHCPFNELIHAIDLNPALGIAYVYRARYINPGDTVELKRGTYTHLDFLLLAANNNPLDATVYAELACAGLVSKINLGNVRIQG